MLLGLLAQPAGAAVLYSIDSVPVTGTIATQTVNASCGANCPTVTTPYDRLLSALLSNPSIAPSGVWTLTGQAGARNFLTVTLTFSGSTLLSSSLTGADEISRCNAGPPCTSSVGTYTATNFSVRGFDTVTGQSFVLSPVPEPATWALMLLGFLGVGVALRRRTTPQPAFAAR
jgi:hypothetical protein